MLLFAGVFFYAAFAVNGYKLVPPSLASILVAGTGAMILYVEIASWLRVMRSSDGREGLPSERQDADA